VKYIQLSILKIKILVTWSYSSLGRFTMRKFLTIVTTATFFAIAFSLIDQYVWNNDFYWLNAGIGFLAGAILVILSKPGNKPNHFA